MRDILFRAYLKDRPMEYFGLHNDWPTNWTGWNTIMQSTGLKDKKGVLIYGGDIVQYAGINCVVDMSIFSFLKPLDRDAWFDLDPSPDTLFQRSSYFEIIGNIYETPELLEKTPLL